MYQSLYLTNHTCLTSSHSRTMRSVRSCCCEIMSAHRDMWSVRSCCCVARTRPGTWVTRGMFSWPTIWRHCCVPLMARKPTRPTLLWSPCCRIGYNDNVCIPVYICIPLTIKNLTNRYAEIRHIARHQLCRSAYLSVLNFRIQV